MFAWWPSYNILWNKRKMTFYLRISPVESCITHHNCSPHLPVHRLAYSDKPLPLVAVTNSDQPLPTSEHKPQHFCSSTSCCYANVRSGLCRCCCQWLRLLMLLNLLLLNLLLLPMPMQMFKVSK